MKREAASLEPVSKYTTTEGDKLMGLSLKFLMWLLMY